MKSVSQILLVLSLAFIGYGYWGAFTAAGNKVYDEMDGYFPFFIMLGGGILLIVFFILLIIRKRKKKKYPL